MLLSITAFIDSNNLLLLVNPDSDAHEFEVPLSSIPSKPNRSEIYVRDIWARKDLSNIMVSTTGSVKVTVPSLDSAFMRLH